MATVQHKNLTDPEIHEPKGIATADNGAILVANGTGSGSWVTLPRYTNWFLSASCSGYLTYAELTGVSGWSSTAYGRHVSDAVNGKMKYTGTKIGRGMIIYSGTVSHNLGAAEEAVHLTILKNGATFSGCPLYSLNIPKTSTHQFHIAALDSMETDDVYSLGAMMVFGTPTISFTNVRVGLFGMSYGYV